MHFGAHIYLFTERWADESLSILDTLRELGLTCVEISVGDDVRFSPGVTRKRAEELGLTLIVSPGGEWPVECDISSDDADERKKGLSWHKRQIDLAAELHAVAYTGALYGHPGTVRKRMPPTDEIPRTAEGLAELAEYGKGKGIAVVIEPMSHFRTHICNTPRQALYLIEKAGHENLFILFDSYHMMTELRDFGGEIRALGARLWGVHACENDRGVPGGGLAPWNDIFAALRDIRFDGFILMETYNSAVGDFAFQRGMFHNVCPDPEDFVRQGVRFLKLGLGYE